jgi:hypothetical protein
MSTQSSTFNQTPSLQPSFVVYFDLLKCESTISKGTVVSQDKCLLPSRFHCIFNKFFLGVLFRDFSQGKKKSTLNARWIEFFEIYVTNMHE